MARFLWNAHVATLTVDNPAVEAVPADPPWARCIGDPTLDFRELRRSHSTFYAILNVHTASRR